MPLVRLLPSFPASSSSPLSAFHGSCSRLFRPNKGTRHCRPSLSRDTVSFLGIFHQKNPRKMYSAFVRRNMQCRASSHHPESEQEQAPAASANNHFMLVSDLDLTMVDHKDPSHAALLNFNCLWAAEYTHNSHLVFSTGRSMQRYSELQKDVPLLTPAVLILSVGTQIRLGKSLKVDTEWEKELDDGWNRDVIVEEALKIPGLRFQEEPDQGPHKVSFKLDKEKADDIQKALSARLLERGLKVKLLYSSSIDLDVLPYKAGKGQALAYLLKKLSQEGSLQRNVLVCGDSGNDIDLFTVDGVHGVIVSNAQEELVKWHKSHGAGTKVFNASQRCAGGIIEALEHFGFGPHLSPNDRINNNFVPSFSSLGKGSLPHPGSVQREVVEFNLFMVKWLRGQVPNSQESFQRLAGVISDGARMVSPWGVESSLAESVHGIRQKHGSMQGPELCIWFDNLHEQKLAEGVHLVTWQPWEQLPGGEKRGYFATAILIAKAGTPNGLEWQHFHETSRKTN